MNKNKISSYVAYVTESLLGVNRGEKRWLVWFALRYNLSSTCECLFLCYTALVGLPFLHYLMHSQKTGDVSALVDPIMSDRLYVWY